MYVCIFLYLCLCIHIHIYIYVPKEWLGSFSSSMIILILIPGPSAGVPMMIRARHLRVFEVWCPAQVKEEQWRIYLASSKIQKTIMFNMIIRIVIILIVNIIGNTSIIINSIMFTILIQYS